MKPSRVLGVFLDGWHRGGEGFLKFSGNFHPDFPISREEALVGELSEWRLGLVGWKRSDPRFLSFIARGGGVLGN